MSKVQTQYQTYFVYKMSCGTYTKEQIYTRDNLTALREMWNGGRVELKRQDGTSGKSRYIGETIKSLYGETSESMGEQLFQEVIWRSTYKVGDEAFSNFTDGDFRRIANEIQKEARRIENPRLSWLERVGFVKRGVMGKWAVTSWMNKHINLATNYERTQFSKYLVQNKKLAGHIRAEALLRDPSLSSKIPGIKSWSQLDRFERKLIFEKAALKKLEGAAKDKKYDEINKLETQISEVLVEKSGQVLSELVEWLSTPIPSTGEKVRAAKPAVLDPVTRKELVPAVRAGQPFARNVIEAGKEARILLNDMGKVLINGLENHKNSVKVAFKHMPTERINRYLKNVEKNRKAIEKGMEKGDYFPHYITDGLMSVESLTNKMDAIEGEGLSIQERAKKENVFLGDLENSFSLIRQSLGKKPDASKDRSYLQYDNWIKNPLTVLRKYSMDAISFNRTNYLKSIYLEGIQRLPKDPQVARELNNYINDVFTLATRGYQDRPVWVNKAVRTLTGIEFLSKIGFGIATAARNTMSGMYFIQSVGNINFARYLKDTNKDDPLNTKLNKIEQEQGFKFEDLSNPLFTEGLLPTEGLRVNDVDIRIDPQTKTASLQYKNDRGWQTFDEILSRATGAGAIFQKVTENFLRKHMFRYSFMEKYKELLAGGLSDSRATRASTTYALDMVNKYAFEYSASQKAPLVGGTPGELGAAGQVAFQFMHYPMSFLQLQSSLLRNSKDAVLARQWNNPDVYIPLKFAGLYLFTQLMSGITNTDLNRLMENDTADRIKDLADVLAGEKDIKGRGYIGPAVGDLMYYATLNEWIKLPDNQITDLVVGYNNAYKLTDEQKGMRMLSTFNVEMAKIPRNWKALQNGTIWNVMMHEFGLYPRAWTRESRKKFPLKYLPWQKQKKKTKKDKKLHSSDAELSKLYRAMGI